MSRMCGGSNMARKCVANISLQWAYRTHYWVLRITSNRNFSFPVNHDLSGNACYCIQQQTRAFAGWNNDEN
jgi:hypothetical protein